MKFGISWNPKETECSVARKIIIYLEAKRVLYVPSEMEVPTHCICSVIEFEIFLLVKCLTLIKNHTCMLMSVQCVKLVTNLFPNVIKEMRI